MLDLGLVDAVRISAAADVRRAAEAFRDIVATMAEVRIAACHNIAVKEPMLDGDGAVLASDVFGWSGADGCWWQNGRIALDSPMPAVCRYESEVFWMNAHGIRTVRPNPFMAEIDLTDFEQRAMTPAAIVVPVHLPFGQIGAVSFNPVDRSLTDLDAMFAEHGEGLGLLARAFITSYAREMCRTQWVPGGFKLSKREIECLRWAAIGKTDNEISTIMSRSRATIRFHMHNASLKLDAVNRSQTVFKATQLGYIALNS